MNVFLLLILLAALCAWVLGMIVANDPKLRTRVMTLFDSTYGEIPPVPPSTDEKTSTTEYLHPIAAKAKYNSELKEHISVKTPLLPPGYKHVLIPVGYTFDKTMALLEKIDNPENLPFWFLPKPVWLKQYLETLPKETK